MVAGLAVAIASQTVRCARICVAGHSQYRAGRIDLIANKVTAQP
jgi:hypothetical protein